MFAYIVVAFELLFFGGAFWYIFIREEKPYQIMGAPWGRYEGVSNRLDGEKCGEISRTGAVVINVATFGRGNDSISGALNNCTQNEAAPSDGPVEQIEAHRRLKNARKCA